MTSLNKYQSLTITLFFLSWSIFPTASYSVSIDQEADFSEMSLSELMNVDIFSAATRLPVEYAKAPGTVYKFDRNDFSRFGIRRLDELLQYVPGLQINQYRKRHRSIWSRGVLERYNDKMVLVVDGIQRRHLYYGHFSLGDEFPIENIKNVEIIVGPASSLYGANAFSGLISITTHNFTNTTKAEISSEIADNNRTKITAQYSNNKVQIFGSYLDQDAAFDENRKSFIGLETMQPTDEYYGNFHIKAELLNDLQLAVDYQNNKTPFLFIPSTQTANIDTRSINTSLQYKKGNLQQGLFEIKGHYTVEDITEYENEQQTRQLAYEEQQDGSMAGLSLMASRNLQDQHLFSVGTSWEYDQADNFDFSRYWHFREGFLDNPKEGSLLAEPKEKNHNLALFFQDIWSINKQIDLTIGGRYDNYDSFGEHFNYRAALVYSPGNTQILKLLFGTATRTPTYREYLKVLDSNFIAPVPNPEKMKTLELAYKHKWQQLNISTTLYRNKFDNYIQEVQTPDGEDEYFSNSKDSWFMNGAELLFQYNLQKKIQMYVALGYVHAQISGTEKLPYIADWTGSVNLDYNYLGQQYIGIGLIYNSERDESNSFDDDRSQAFTLVDIQMRGKISRQIDYSLGVDNLFNKKVYDPSADFGNRYNTEKTEREIWAKLSIKFDF
jgi:outer membrane receptor for ferrienterochelin and colicin